jgi:branched-chain amino acid transport system substrate-binding protein
VLGAHANIPTSYIVGTPSAGPIADSDTEQAWLDFVKDYQTTFKSDTTALPSPSLFALSYYVNTAAVLLALKQVNGDLSNGEKAFMTALAGQKFDTPTGPVSLDANRNAIANEFVTEVAQNAGGSLFNKVVSVTKQVDQTLGLGATNALFAQPVSRDSPACP